MKTMKEICLELATDDIVQSLHMFVVKTNLIVENQNGLGVIVGVNLQDNEDNWSVVYMSKNQQYVQQFLADWESRYPNSKTTWEMINVADCPKALEFWKNTPKYPFVNGSELPANVEDWNDYLRDQHLL